MIFGKIGLSKKQFVGWRFWERVWHTRVELSNGGRFIFKRIEGQAFRSWGHWELWEEGGNAAVARWALRVQGFDFEIELTSGDVLRGNRICWSLLHADGSKTLLAFDIGTNAR